MNYRPRFAGRTLLLAGITICTAAAAAQPDGDPAMPAAEAKHTNRLIHATSPYLLQHAHNPVDWYEWGPEAFEKARREDKPVFLSIGYAACHWCHVMEHECFEDEDVAAVLNDHFVSIKVDREERPDIDEIYMAYTQALTGHGGWPMSVWLSPDGTPFYAGTYFPQEQFVALLTNIDRLWRTNREQITGAHANAREFFAQWSAAPQAAEGVIAQARVDEVAQLIARYFDRTRGGMRSDNNKFPPSMAMELMLRVHRRTGDAGLLEAVTVTLDHMARGGIYDHLGGGICRYSTDPEWLVPHFEKMLYDQALVSSIYLDAYQATRDPLYAHVAADIFDYVIADLQSAEGGFYSTRDADSDGLEGAYYIWTVDQVREILGEEDARLFCAYYDVTDAGNWFEHRGHAPPGPKNILRVTKPPQVFAKMHDLSVEELTQKLAAWRPQMLAARARRTPPGLDDKVLTEWNGLMIASLAKGARVLEEPKYAEAAARAADFVLTNLRRDGRLLRSWRNGQAKLPAYLTDYAALIEGLLNLYEATFERRWLDEAVALNETLIRYYWDGEAGGFFLTASDAEQLIARSKDPHDTATPSGNSVAAMNLLRLAVMLDRKDYREKGETMLRVFSPLMEQQPAAHERMLCAVDFYHDRVMEIALVGPIGDCLTALVRTLYERYLPNKVLLHGAGGDSELPLLKGRTAVNGRATAYVCENYTCRLPVTEPEKLTEQLGR